MYGRVIGCDGSGSQVVGKMGNFVDYMLQSVQK